MCPISNIGKNVTAKAVSRNPVLSGGALKDAGLDRESWPARVREFRRPDQSPYARASAARDTFNPRQASLGGVRSTMTGTVLPEYRTAPRIMTTFLAQTRGSRARKLVPAPVATMPDTRSRK